MSRFLRKLALVLSLTAPGWAQAAVLDGVGTADNLFNAYLSPTLDPSDGVLIAFGDDWGLPGYVDTSLSALVEGQNYFLLVDAYNEAPGPAMFVGSFSISGGGFVFANGGTTLGTDTAHWTSSTQSFAAATGKPYDMTSSGLWSTYLDGYAGAAIWAYKANWVTGLQGHAYFVTRITATTAAVPEPASAVLLIAGAGCLVALARRRRRRPD